MAASLPDMAFAGTGGTEFDASFDWIEDTLGGAGGKLIGGVSVAVGAILATARSSIMPLIPAVGIGAGVALGPGVIDDMFTALV